MSVPSFAPHHHRGELLLFWCIFLCSPARPFVAAAGTSFLRAARINEADAAQAFLAEFADTVDKERLDKLEASLQTSYTALPKNADGTVGHQAVRYILHRLFVQRHGWYIKGLEPGTVGKARSDQEWVPNFLQSRLEERQGKAGASLRHLAAVAAAIEDLIRKEVSQRLEAAYTMHGLPSERALEQVEAEEVLRTYFIGFLVAGNFSAAGVEEVERKTQVFVRKYSGWNEAEAWFLERLRQFYGREGTLSFDDTTRVATEIGEKYYEFNDLECSSLKSTLLGMEGRKAGRVRLSTFYKKALHSHWRFTEKADYLRMLGALDDSSPHTPQVIVPNYLMARTNCLEASGLYALCCRNECEDLMGRLEAELGAPEAAPGRLAELVAGMPSDTVAAPRNLSGQLVEYLERTAASNGGRVPIHGRLFAQWMHHAFPRECPYPHASGTTSPLTPDEWMDVSGHGSTSATREEMLREVETDACAASAGPQGGHNCGEETVDLPWNEAEELLVVSAPHSRGFRGDDTLGGPLRLGKTFLSVLAAGMLLFALCWDQAKRRAAGKAGRSYSPLDLTAADGGRSSCCSSSSCSACACFGTGTRLALMLSTAMLLASALGLLDELALAFGMCGGIVALAFELAKTKLGQRLRQRGGFGDKCFD